MLAHAVAVGPCSAAAAPSAEIDYRHHILAVDEHGSAIEPLVKITSRAHDGTPTGWTVKYRDWDTENTQRGDQMRFRMEFSRYVEAVGGVSDDYTRGAGANVPDRDGIFENYRRLYRAGKVDRVVFYVHGGMNNVKGAGEKACELTHAMLADGIYPICIVWNSNLFDTYGEHLLSVRDGLRDAPWGLVTLPAQLIADVGSAAARTPLSVMKLLRNDFNHLFPERFHRARQAQARYENMQNACRLGPDGKPICTSPIVVHAAPDETGPFRKAESVASYAAFLGRKLTTVPVIDTLGTSAWFNMLRRTRVMFERESSFVNEKLNAEIRGEDPAKAYERQTRLRWASRQGALRVFFDLAQKQLAVAKGKYPPVTLIGHSMGAIVCGEVLARYRELPFDNVVFMAAASSVNDFKLKVAPYLDRQTGCRFFNLCLSSANETGEREPFDWFEIAPRGSLLVWIDSLFDSPVAEDDRTMGRFENAILATDWLPSSATTRTTIKAFGRNREFQLSDTASVPFPYDARNAGNPSYRGPLVEPQKHGNFSNYGAAKAKSYRFWRPYFWTAEPIKPAEMSPKTRALKPLPVDARKLTQTSGAANPGFWSRVFARAPSATEPLAKPQRAALSAGAPRPRKSSAANARTARL